MAGSQVFQKAGATIVANNRVFDKDITISLGGETVKLHMSARAIPIAWPWFYSSNKKPCNVPTSAKTKPCCTMIS